MGDRVTLITGASSGIGTELARVFASKGHRLAMVDRRGDRLTTLAAEIVAAGGTAPILIPGDLEHPDACDEIAAALDAERVEVEFVVNNAGFGLFGYTIELDRAEQLSIIAVNILAMTDLPLRFSDSLIPASRRHPQSRFACRLSAGPRDGGVLCVQGLCPLLQRSATSRTRPARSTRDDTLSRFGVDGISSARRD
jgi:NAD(P)-dependent dehydrogenase (short-subunit alcohol dehydrogenase family)